MPAAEQMLTSPATFNVLDSQTNATATATQAAKAGARHFVTGLTISASAAPAAAVTAQLKDGNTVIDQFEIPAGAFAPILHNYTRPLRGSVNSAITLVVPALGASVKGTAVIHGFTAQE